MTKTHRIKGRTSADETADMPSYIILSEWEVSYLEFAKWVDLRKANVIGITKYRSVDTYKFVNEDDFLAFKLTFTQRK